MYPANPPRPYRISPLVSGMGIPPGYRFDERSGTLQQVGNPPTTPPAQNDRPDMAPMPDAEWITEKLESSYKPPIGELGVENRPPHPNNS